VESEQPTLIDAELELRDGDGKMLDTAASYTAIRSVGVSGDRFTLNGRHTRCGWCWTRATGPRAA